MSLKLGHLMQPLEKFIFNDILNMGSAECLLLPDCFAPLCFLFYSFQLLPACKP